MKNGVLIMEDNKKCPKCGCSLIISDNYYVCESCGAKFVLEKTNKIDQEQNYNYALNLINEKRYKEAITILQEIRDYKDSNILLEQSIDNLNKQNMYDTAKALYYDYDYYRAYNIFISLGDYLDSNILSRKVEKQLNKSYDDGIDFYNKKEYYTAKNIFSNIKEHKESKSFIDKCNEVIKRFNKKVCIISLIIIISITIISLVGTIMGKANSTYSLKVVNNELVITEYKKNSYEVVIPGEISYNFQKLNVTTIGEKAFYNNQKINKVVIPEGVTTIEAKAFAKCPNLTEIVLPSTIESIDSLAFDETHIYKYTGPASALHNFDFRLLDYCCINSGVVTNSVFITALSPDYFEITDNVLVKTSYLYDARVYAKEAKVPANAIKFLNRIALEKLTISSGIIDDDCFDSSVTSKTLKEIIISDGITTISNMAFDGIRGLFSITIPASVTQIGYGNFIHCESLGEIIVDPNNPVYSSPNNSNIIYDKEKCEVVATCKNSVLFEGIKSIGKLAYSYSRIQEDLVLPNSVEKIDEQAFFNSFFTSITLGNNVSYIGYEAFTNSKLKEVVMANGVTQIGKHAFANCNILEKVTLSDSLTTIPSYCFEGCTKLSTIHFPNELIVIDDHAFHACNSITNLVLPYTLQKISDYAFESCQSIESITIDVSVTTIARGAFNACDPDIIYYEGAENGWDNITIEALNSCLKDKSIIVFKQ